MSATAASVSHPHLSSPGLQGTERETSQPLLSSAFEAHEPRDSRAPPIRKPLQQEPAHSTMADKQYTIPSGTIPDAPARAGSLGSSPPLPSQSRALPKERPSSPNLPSAASSMIFERNVQESTLPVDVAPAIPAHIKTEDQIPPALEASSLAITDGHLGPEEVEIVTHVAHQPAAAAIAQSITSAHQSESNLPLSLQESPPHEQQIFHSQHELDEAASSYGALDPNDVRRLSFISFADVVHAEHVESHSTQSLHHVPISSPPLEGASTHANHSARPTSPARSPISSFSQTFSPGVITPPTSASGPSSAKGLELSPARSQTGSPLASSPHQHGDLAIETLSQALRKTASGDLSGLNRSPPTSAI